MNSQLPINENGDRSKEKLWRRILENKEKIKTLYISMKCRGHKSTQFNWLLMERSQINKIGFTSRTTDGLLQFLSRTLIIKES
jgi:hypothetical protein